MVENKKNATEQRDYKERFEFRLTFGNDIIICQRYFRINNFNPVCLNSTDLTDSIRYCANLIDDDLKMKTRTYLEIVSPRVFENEEEMNAYLADETHKKGMTLGEGIVLRDSKAPNYVWGKNGEAVLSPTQFSDGEFTEGVTDEDVVTYKLEFMDNGKSVCSTIWDGIYPKYIRKSIDLSNRGPKVETENDVYGLGFDAYLRYKLTEGKSDLVFKIIKEICTVCSYPDKNMYHVIKKAGKPEKKAAEKKNKAE